MRSSFLLPLVASALLACHETPRAESSSAPMRDGSRTQQAPGNAGGSAPKLNAEGLIAAGSDGRRPVGNDPGGMGHGTPLNPRAGHQLAAFAAGCFWWSRTLSGRSQA